MDVYLLLLPGEGRENEVAGSREAGEQNGVDAEDCRGEAHERGSEAERARGEDVGEGGLHSEDRALALILFLLQVALFMWLRTCL